MPFGLKDASTIFSRIVVTTFTDFIQNVLAVYMDEWTVYGLIKDHFENLWLMLERCWQHQIMLNSKKCILCAPFGVLLGHIVCKEGLSVDPSKTTHILIFPPPMNVKQLRATLGVTERNSYGLGYHNWQINSRNQSFPICKRNQTSNTKGSRFVPYSKWLM